MWRLRTTGGDSAAWLLWRSPDHRPVTPAERDQSRRSLRTTLAAPARIPAWASGCPECNPAGPRSVMGM
jgi:hypothetical protein